MSCINTSRKNGLRPTPQRSLIIDIIHDHSDFLTVGEIFGYVHIRDASINKSTVYRTLKILEELGYVFKSDFGGKFIYHSAEEGLHHYLVCQMCGKCISCDNNIFRDVEKATIETYGFQVSLNHKVSKGLCQGCRNKD